jgi:hypothetical protein
MRGFEVVCAGCVSVCLAHCMTRFLHVRKLEPLAQGAAWHSCRPEDSDVWTDRCRICLSSFSVPLQTNRIQSVLFGMLNRTLDPYLAR